MQRKPQRPLSPHLSIWRPGVWMAVSITHRITGVGLSTVGLAMLVWFVVAIAAGPSHYATFTYFAGSLIGRIVLIGLSWALFQHIGSGIRHFIMDIGAGYELQTAKRSALAVFILAIAATAAFWVYLLYR